jgi:hypothetical protein
MDIIQKCTDVQKNRGSFRLLVPERETLQIVGATRFSGLIVHEVRMASAPLAAHVCCRASMPPQYISPV